MLWQTALVKKMEDNGLGYGGPRTPRAQTPSSLIAPMPSQNDALYHDAKPVGVSDLSEINPGSPPSNESRTGPRPGFVPYLSSTSHEVQVHNEEEVVVYDVQVQNEKPDSTLGSYLGGFGTGWF